MAGVVLFHHVQRPTEGIGARRRAARGRSSASSGRATNIPLMCLERVSCGR
jgi:hypothetical protein